MSGPGAGVLQTLEDDLAHPTHCGRNEVLRRVLLYPAERRYLPERRNALGLVHFRLTVPGSGLHSETVKKGIIVVAALLLLLVQCRAQTESLPAPVLNGNSFEILSNSRYSVHSGFTSALPRQVVSNVLWAMNRVPHLGSYREFYVATPENVYRYDSSAHALVVHLSGDHRYNSGSAYEVGIACARHEEAGFAVQAGLLAGTAFWNSESATVASCPMRYAADYANANWNPAESIKMVNVFGRAATTGLTTYRQAWSSDSTLPLPATDGADTFEVVLAGWHQDSVFASEMPSEEDISQILWAGYGVTPHLAYNGNRGTTIPSAVGQYYLTRLIYLVREDGVWRYHNRLPPGTGLNTSDHRIELIASGDRRAQLRAACPGIPSTAPTYVVVCVLDTSRYRDMQEAGFAGFQHVTQALSMGLQGFLTTPLTPAERTAIIVALGLPSDRPALVFSCGAPPVAIEEAEHQTDASVRLAVSSGRAPLHIDYSLGREVAGRLVFYDLVGRPVREFFFAPTVSGPYRFDWNGKTEDGRKLPPGFYLGRLEASGSVASARFLLLP